MACKLLTRSFGHNIFTQVDPLNIGAFVARSKTAYANVAHGLLRNSADGLLRDMVILKWSYGGSEAHPPLEYEDVLDFARAARSDGHDS